MLYSLYIHFSKKKEQPVLDHYQKKEAKGAEKLIFPAKGTGCSLKNNVQNKSAIKNI